MQDARQRIQDITYKWDEEVVKRAGLVLGLTGSVEKIRDARRELLELKLWHIEAKSDITGLVALNADIMQRLEIEKQNVRETTEETQKLREEGRVLTEQVRQAIQSDEQRDLYASLAKDKSPEDVRIEMEAEAAKLELIHAVNPNVMREFEKRAQEIARIKRKMESSSGKLAELMQQLESVMGKFEPKLEELVSQINDAFAYNFEQISCAGEIRIHKEEDFDLWALDVMVKFRENETLQQLTAHRQSGGERAVSTIFYLMALQSMAQSPFRVVDEINQGMDPRNERMVHERMVEIACREHTSQYFLITPKLLTGLRYDAKMRVLCIASGEHMPREGRKLDFRRCLSVQKALMAGG
jgi:chromosome segregation ATPase